MKSTPRLQQKVVPTTITERDSRLNLQDFFKTDE